MKFIEISLDYGLIIKCEALTRLNISIDFISKEMGFEFPLDANEYLISFGPFFGGEASDNFIQHLSKFGLVYVDDFFVFHGDFPDWCRFGASFVDSKESEN